MLVQGDKVVVIKEETFDKIYIYGFGIIEDVHYNYNEEPIYEVKLEEKGYVIETDYVIHITDWVEYVDERDAKVIRVKYEA